MVASRRLIESLRVAGGKAQLLSYHKERMERSLLALGASPFLDLENYVRSLIERYQPREDCTYKLRFEYDTTAIYEPSCTLYIPRRVDRLIPYEIEDIDCYNLKWADRRCLEPSPAIYQRLEEEPHTELILTHQGLLTDTRYSNIALQLDEGQWLTPTRPLLKGTMRQYLLDRGIIKEANLSIDDLERCRRFRLINAMLPWD